MRAAQTAAIGALGPGYPHLVTTVDRNAGIEEAVARN
jgi:hypothetical protein